MKPRSQDDLGVDLIETSVRLSDQLEQCLEMIDKHQSFLVVSHQAPDGDAVGSTLAMGLFLESLGKDVTLYNHDAPPYNFRFLEGAERFVTQLGDRSIDATIILDCGELGRIGDRLGRDDLGDEIIVVDHHDTWDAEFADAYVRDVDAAATGELVYQLMVAAGVELTVPIAEALYCCLMTDTGSFRYSNTSQTTFRVAGELIAAGVQPWRMTSNIYESQPCERLELLALVLETLELSADGRLAFLRVDRDMFAQTDTGPELTDGFINYARSISGVEVATLLRQQDGDQWRVSFRSRGIVDVSQLAAKFGGGGHKNAAGCMVVGTSTAVVEQLGDALVELLGPVGDD